MPHLPRPAGRTDRAKLVNVLPALCERRGPLSDLELGWLCERAMSWVTPCTAEHGQQALFARATSWLLPAVRGFGSAESPMKVGM